MTTVGTLFSGIGVPDLAAEMHGMRVLWQVEIDDYCNRVLARHFPHATRHRDIHDCHDLPYVDVLTAGFPCQPFSVAGNRKGSDDDRALAPEMMRIIRETRPRICLLENVPGFASLHDGAEFKVLLRAFAEMGYDAEWGHLRASDVGAPHQRERWWLVAYAARCQYPCVGKTGSHQPMAEVFNDGFTECNSTLVNPGGAGLQECVPAAVASGTRHAARRPAAVGHAERRRQHRDTRRRSGSQPAYRRARLPEPGLGRGVDGSAGGLDFVGWPAAPGQPHHDYEPPRITTGTPNRSKRLKALGNAWVFPLAYELMGALSEWLEKEAVTP